jgi:hypothetical protein
MAVTFRMTDLHQPLTDAEIEAVLRPVLDAIDPLAEVGSERDSAGSGRAGPGRVWLGSAGQGKARALPTAQTGKARSGLARLGGARHRMARQGED